MHNLLIEKKMDGFTVIEARDASITVKGMPSDVNEVRKRVYRQIWQFENKNWLRSEGEGRVKKYFQTEQFIGGLFAPKKKLKSNEKSISDYSALRHECNEYKGELEIVLGEIDEYQSLKSRFPELELKLTPLQEQAKKRSARLLGKMNVLTNVLKTLSEDHQAC